MFQIHDKPVANEWALRRNYSVSLRYFLHPEISSSRLRAAEHTHAGMVSSVHVLDYNTFLLLVKDGLEL